MVLPLRATPRSSRQARFGLDLRTAGVLCPRVRTFEGDGFTLNHPFFCELRFLENFMHAFWGVKSRAGSGWSMRAARWVKIGSRSARAVPEVPSTAPRHRRSRRFAWRRRDPVKLKCWLANECPQNGATKALPRAREKPSCPPWPMYKPRRTHLVALIDHLDRAQLHLNASKSFFEGSTAPSASCGAPKTPPQHLR